MSFTHSKETCWGSVAADKANILETQNAIWKMSKQMLT